MKLYRFFCVFSYVDDSTMWQWHCCIIRASVCQVLLTMRCARRRALVDIWRVFCVDPCIRRSACCRIHILLWTYFCSNLCAVHSGSHLVLLTSSFFVFVFFILHKSFQSVISSAINNLFWNYPKILVRTFSANPTEIPAKAGTSEKVIDVSHLIT